MPLEPTLDALVHIFPTKQNTNNTRTKERNKTLSVNKRRTIRQRVRALCSATETLLRSGFKKRSTRGTAVAKIWQHGGERTERRQYKCALVAPSHAADIGGRRSPPSSRVRKEQLPVNKATRCPGLAQWTAKFRKNNRNFTIF